MFVSDCGDVFVRRGTEANLRHAQALLAADLSWATMRPEASSSCRARRQRRR